MDFESFQHAHSAQLDKIPRVYWRALYEKLQYEVRYYYFHETYGLCRRVGTKLLGIEAWTEITSDPYVC